MMGDRGRQGFHGCKVYLLFYQVGRSSLWAQETEKRTNLPCMPRKEFQEVKMNFVFLSLVGQRARGNQFLKLAPAGFKGSSQRTQHGSGRGTSLHLRCTAWWIVHPTVSRHMHYVLTFTLHLLGFYKLLWIQVLKITQQLKTQRK